MVQELVQFMALFFTTIQALLVDRVQHINDGLTVQSLQAAQEDAHIRVDGASIFVGRLGVNEPKPEPNSGRRYAPYHLPSASGWRLYRNGAQMYATPLTA